MVPPVWQHAADTPLIMLAGDLRIGQKRSERPLGSGCRILRVKLAPGESSRSRLNRLTVGAKDLRLLNGTMSKG
jgi:hypothetical protein